MIEDISAGVHGVAGLLAPSGEGLARLSRETVPALAGSPILMLEGASLQGDWPRAAALAKKVASRRRGYESHPGGVVGRVHQTLARLKTRRSGLRADLAFVRTGAP